LRFFAYNSGVSCCQRGAGGLVLAARADNPLSQRPHE